MKENDREDGQGRQPRLFLLSFKYEGQIGQEQQQVYGPQ